MPGLRDLGNKTTMKAALSIALALAAAGLLAATPAAAQPAAPKVPLDPATSLFCKNDRGDIEVMKFASLGSVIRKFKMRFDFSLSIEPDPMTLVFSNPAESPYFIRIKAMPYKDDNGHSGIALLSLHLSLENTDQEIEGTGMCFFAAFGS